LDTTESGEELEKELKLREEPGEVLGVEIGKEPERSHLKDDCVDTSAVVEVLHPMPLELIKDVIFFLHLSTPA
jgi:hypothetical protein